MYLNSLLGIKQAVVVEQRCFFRKALAFTFMVRSFMSSFEASAKPRGRYISPLRVAKRSLQNLTV